MSKKGKWVAGTLIALVVLIGVVSYLFMSMIGKPLYEVGMVRDSKNLSVPIDQLSTTEPQSDFWLVEENVELYHFSNGTGKKILVVHGGPGYPFSDPLPGLTALSDQHEFIYYDQRGSGKSTRPFDTFSGSNFYKNMKMLDQKLGLGAQIADIERIRRILDEDKLSIIGHSFGAFIAALYAAEFPQRVDSLVLVSPADLLKFPSPRGDLYSQVKNLLPENMKEDYEAYQRKFMDFKNVFKHSEQSLIDLSNGFTKFYAAAIEAKGLTLPDLSSDSRSGGWMVMGMFFSMGKENDYRRHLGAVSAPVLVVHGENDLQPAAASESYVEAFPNADFKVIGDAGHFSFLEKPQEFATTISEFYEKVM